MTKGLFVGLATVDLGYLVADYPGEDTKATALDQFTAAGGPATNAAVTFAYLGGSARLATSLGRHWLTRVVREDLEQHGVEVTDLTPDAEGAPPASSIIVAQSTASRTIVSLDATRTHAPTPADPVALLGDAGVVLVDGHLTEPCAALAEAARTAGVAVVFDGGRWRDSHAELLRHVSVAICSNRFAPPDAAGDVHAYLHGLGVQHVAITNGEAPIRWSSASGGSDVIKPPSIRAVDTLGAGDIFHGAASYYLTAGYEFPDALQAASVVAAASCESFGTRSWMTTQRDRYPV
ncbi:PfkB family carbohydrate kinase [Longispora sp. NPDC051575]|uniref:PfkB family carbohydrate kinase n=1 Tax=Longispora sp. NPDC051575 TaxID=3154943 RepID=UPI003444EA00